MSSRLIDFGGSAQPGSAQQQSASATIRVAVVAHVSLHWPDPCMASCTFSSAVLYGYDVYCLPSHIWGIVIITIIARDDSGLELTHPQCSPSRYAGSAPIADTADTIAAYLCVQWSPVRVVCHERRMSYLRRATVREMKEGPSSSVIRSRSQATASCCGQKPWW